MKESEEIVVEIEAKLGEKEKVINTLNAKVEVLKEELAKSQELRESLTREASYYRGKYEAAQEGRALVGNVGESKPEEDASGEKKEKSALRHQRPLKDKPNSQKQTKK
jgi:uncharacterized coiled-coil protein SlyX